MAATARRLGELLIDLKEGPTTLLLCCSPPAFRLLPREPTSCCRGWRHRVIRGPRGTLLRLALSLKFLMPFADSETSPLPDSVEAYEGYRWKAIRFVEARNRRMVEYVNGV